MNNIANRIKMIRNEFGLNQKEFAERLGVTNAHISRMEKGITTPSEALMKLMCKEFEINIEWLKSGTQPMFESDYNIDDKMEKAVSTFNKLMHSENSTVRNQAAELNLLFSNITNIEFSNDDMKILYLNNLINLFSIIDRYTATIKDTIETGQQTLEEVQNINFTLFKNDLQNYVDELQRILFLSQK